MIRTLIDYSTHCLLTDDILPNDVPTTSTTVPQNKPDPPEKLLQFEDVDESTLPQQTTNTIPFITPQSSQSTFQEYNYMGGSQLTPELLHSQPSQEKVHVHADIPALSPNCIVNNVPSVW